MNPDRRPDRALLLAGVALLGLVIAPVLHAMEHAREAEDDAGESVAVAWGAVPGDSLDALAFALEHAHQRPPSPPRREHGHSHGPPRSGPHGAGALLHHGAALHASPQVPELRAGAPEHTAPAAIRGQLRGTPRRLASEWSQAPPPRC